MKLRNSLCVALFASLLGGAPLALAQSDQDQIAEATFNEAETYYNLRKWEKALEKYEEAYTLSQKPELLFNIGQCYRQMGRYDDAIGSYQSFLRFVPDDNPNRETAKELIESTKELKKRSTQTSSTLSTSLASQEPDTKPNPSKKSNVSPWRPLLLGGIGGLGASAIFGVVSIQRAIDAQDNIEVGQAQVGGDLFQSAKTVGLVSDVLLVAGAGAVVAGFVLHNKEKETSISFSPLSNNRSVTVSVKF